MAKISELMEGKKIGEIKIRREHWLATSYFLPIDNRGGRWIGWDADGCGKYFYDDKYPDWELCEEQKPKTKLVEIVAKYPERFIVHRPLFVREKHLSNYPNAILTGRTLEIEE